MNTEQRIVEMIGKIGGKGEYEIMTAKVKSVNENDKIIEVEAEEVRYANVRLQAVSDGSKGMILIPKVDSYVTIGKLMAMNNWVLLNCTKLDKVLIDCETVIYNGGENAGLVKVKELTKELNDLQKEFNKLKQVLVSWVPVPNDGGAALKGAINSFATQQMILTQQNKIENPKIKH